MQHATCNKAYYTATKLATLQHNVPSARAQPAKAVSVTCSSLSDGRRMEQPRTY